jgi:hypothetical protein
LSWSGSRICLSLGLHLDFLQANSLIRVIGLRSGRHGIWGAVATILAVACHGDAEECEADDEKDACIESVTIVTGSFGEIWGLTIEFPQLQHRRRKGQQRTRPL